MNLPTTRRMLRWFRYEISMALIGGTHSPGGDLAAHKGNADPDCPACMEYRAWRERRREQTITESMREWIDYTFKGDERYAPPR